MNISESDAVAIDPLDDEELALWSLDDVLDLTADVPSPSTIDHEIIDPTWSFEDPRALPQATFG